MTALRGRAVRCLWAAGAAFVMSSTPLLAKDGPARDEAAHDIATQFSHTTKEADRRAQERRLEDERRFKADEAEMLERAKAEAAERRALQLRRDSEARAKADAERLARETAEAKMRDDAARLAKAEDERKAREKSEVERVAREAADAKAREDAVRLAKAEEQRKAKERAEAERRVRETAEAKARDDAARLAKADAERRTMEAAREEEGRRLSEKLRKARAERELKSFERGFSALGNPPPPGTLEKAEPAPAAKPPVAPRAVVETVRAETPRQRPYRPVHPDKEEPQHETQATVLLIIDPGSRGIRRNVKTADPVLCTGAFCYISNGPDRAATKMTRARALGPGNTLGGRAGACRHALGCVYRGVDVGAGEVELQPVDLRILRHDRREVQVVEPDSSCRTRGGRLECSHGVRSASYNVWVVPESIADRAGPPALLSAIDRGLPDWQAAELGTD